MRKHPLAECEKCPLLTIGRYVPSCGPDKAKVAFLGEAPGKNEVYAQEPFVGVSGQLLNRVIENNGMKREEVFLSNACLCRPPDNDTPSATAVSCCRPRLIAELKDRQVETVVAMGNPAIRSMLGVEGVNKLRVGPAKKSKFLPGIRVIPTFHPAACLRSADSFPFLVTDVGKIEIKPTDTWALPRYRVSTGREHALALVSALWAYDPLVIDIETGQEKDEVFEHQDRYDLLCIGIGFEKDRVVVISKEDVKDKLVLYALSKLFKAKRLIMHNGKSDCSGLYPTMGDVPLWFDTMLAHYSLDERSGAPIRQLGILGQELLGFPDWKSWVKPYTKDKSRGFADVPEDLLYKYNAVDCQATWDLYELFIEQLDEEDVRKLHDFLVWCSNDFKYIELPGIRIDEGYNEELTVSYLEILEKMEAEINSIVFPKSYNKGADGINPRSPPQITKYLADQNINVTSTDEDTINLILTDIEKQGRIYRTCKDPTEVVTFCEALLKQRKEQKLYSTYIKGLRKKVEGGRVYPNFLFHGTNTGRLSCRNPNVQNIVRKAVIKKQFIPDPGNVFVQADYSQAELRVITWLAQESYFRDIFNGTSRDVFDELSLELYGDLSHLSQEEYKEVRAKKVKPFAYGLSYGRTAYAIALENSIPLREAEAAVQKFFSLIPNIVRWQEDVRRTVLDSKDLVTPFGRHRRFWLITNENRKDVLNEALAFMPQSIASDICLRAAVRLRGALVGLGQIRNVVHDSILVDCRPEVAAQVGTIMNDYMIQSAQDVVGDYVKFATEYKIGSHWGEV